MGTVNEAFDPHVEHEKSMGKQMGFGVGTIECKDPHLGLATTHQLIMELVARSETKSL